MEDDICRRDAEHDLIDLERTRIGHTMDTTATFGILCKLVQAVQTKRTERYFVVSAWDVGNSLAALRQSVLEWWLWVPVVDERKVEQRMKGVD